MKTPIVCSLIAIALYIIGVYLSGWHPCRGINAVFVYFEGIMFGCLGYFIGSMIKEEKL